MRANRSTEAAVLLQESCYARDQPRKVCRLSEFRARPRKGMVGRSGFEPLKA